MNNSPEFTTSSPQERLAAGKTAFRTSFLENDSAFGVLQKCLAGQARPDAALPDFGLEPTLRRSEDGIPTSDIGLRISRSATQADGELSTHGIVLYDYVPLGQMNRKNGSFKPSPKLLELLAAIGKTKEDSLDIVGAWQAGSKEMSAHFADPVVIDPMTATFELAEEVEPGVYVNEEAPDGSLN